MASQKVRTSLSKRNPYYIPKYVRMELKYFCLQYPEWKKFLATIGHKGTSDEFSDPTGDEAVKRVIFEEKIVQIERACMIAAPDIYTYLLKAVTEDLSYVNLSSKHNIPCGPDLFYDRYHKFWFVLSQEKHMF